MVMQPHLLLILPTPVGVMPMMADLQVALHRSDGTSDSVLCLQYSTGFLQGPTALPETACFRICYLPRAQSVLSTLLTSCDVGVDMALFSLKSGILIMLLATRRRQLTQALK